MFCERNGEGQCRLRHVLTAYVWFNQDLGYCQGMGMVAGLFIMHMGEEDAFWCLVSVLDQYLRGMFDQGLKEIMTTCRIFHRLLLLKVCFLQLDRKHGMTHCHIMCCNFEIRVLSFLCVCVLAFIFIFLFSDQRSMGT